MSSTRHERPVVTTSVGRALFGDNHFRGKSVADELVGRPMAAVYALAIGGPELTDEQARVLDALVAASMASDPRIWPLKIAPLVGSYGSVFAGYSATVGTFEDNMVSPKQSTYATRTLLEIRSREDAGEALEDVITSWRGHMAGFGVPARPVDERVETFARWYEEHVPANERPTWTLVRRIQATSPRHKPNITAATAAVCIDLGFDPHHAALLTAAYANLCALATASEASQACESSLKSVPDAFIDYVGPPPSTSPRTRRRVTPDEMP